MFMKCLKCTLVLSLIVMLGACSIPSSDESGDKISPFFPSAKTNPPPPPLYNSIYYNSIEELIQGISNDFTEEVIQDVEQNNSGAIKGAFRSFTESLTSGASPLYVPYHEGKMVSFRDEEGFPNISLYPSELYERTWISYRIGTRQSAVRGISIMYLDDSIKSEAKREKGSWLRSQLNPNYPNVDNYKKGPDYEVIYDSVVEFDGKSVNSLIIQFKGKTGVSMFFVHDDILVSIALTPGAGADKWLEGLTFEKIYLN